MSRTIDFNKEEIIDKAMQVFWEKGYDGTSLKDLQSATGLLKGSLYNTFKSKENLFLLCLNKYGQHSQGFHYKSGDPGEYLKSFFKRLVSEGIKEDFTKGCLIMNSCLEFSNDQGSLSQSSKALFDATEHNLKNVTTKIVADSKEAKRIGAILISAAFSIREISKFRKDRAFLKQIANNALKEVELSI